MPQLTLAAGARTWSVPLAMFCFRSTFFRTAWEFQRMLHATEPLRIALQLSEHATQQLVDFLLLGKVPSSGDSTLCDCSLFFMLHGFELQHAAMRGLRRVPHCVIRHTREVIRSMSNPPPSAATLLRYIEGAPRHK